MQVIITNSLTKDNKDREGTCAFKATLRRQIHCHLHFPLVARQRQLIYLQHYGENLA